MKSVFPVFLIILLASCANGKEKIYIGSTPATNIDVRSFLGIPFADSIDFIKWKVTLTDNSYSLQCQFGISKPNTDGFINDGTKIQLKGALKKENNYYFLKNADRTLMMLRLNTNLLHLLSEDKSLLIGNGGWSYTLNSNEPSVTDQINVIPKQGPLKDSIAFEGRTPCGVPGIIAPGRVCYKLKWYIVLYSNTKKNEPVKYKVLGTPWRKEGGRTGSWKIIRGKNNRIIYHLNDEKENGFIYLLNLDENILVFTDAKGNLLVGDNNFSFTLNRVL